MPRERTYGDGPSCTGCGRPAVWGGKCQMEDGIGHCAAMARRSNAQLAHWRVSEWRTIDSAPDDRIVLTRTGDSGYSGDEIAMRRRGEKWFVPDGSCAYGFWAPTHWAEVSLS